MAPWGTRRICLLLGLLSLALYGVSIGYGFIEYDDQRIVLGQRNLFGTGFMEGASAIFSRLPREEPLIVRDLAWLVDSHVFGFTNPLGYHLGNVLLNALDVVLFFLFVQGTTRRRELALVIALFFAITPVHVEPVCWVMGRKDLLSAAFMLAALVIQNVLLERRSTPLYLVTIACTACAVLSKVSAAPFFLVLFLHRALAPHLSGQLSPGAPLDRRRLLRSAVVVAPHALVSVALTAWYHGVLAQYGLLERGPSLQSAQHLLLLSSFVPLVLVECAKLLLFPFRLAIFYDFPAVGRSASAEQYATAYLVTAALAAACLYTLVRRKDLFFHLGSALALLVPYLNLQYIGIWVANRYLYLISAFVISAVVTLCAERMTRRVAVAAATVCALLFMWVIAAWLPAWRDNASLWEHETKAAAPSMLAFSAMSRVLVHRAEQTRSPDDVQAARAMIERGSSLYRALRILPVDGYHSYQRGYFAKLQHFRGRTLAVEGAPPEEQLLYHLEAYALAPTSLHSLMLATTYGSMAARSPGQTREALARKSFSHFERYALAAWKEIDERPRVANLAGELAASLPELRADFEHLWRRLGSK